MNITQSLQKWGNSTGIRIPKKVVDAAKLRINQELIITLQDDSIVLTPIKDKNNMTLESLLTDVEPDKIGGELDWGEDVGAEKYE
jgi:antitoxin MazE